MTKAVFAIPGELNQRTGGYIYDATVLRLLNVHGCPTEHLRLPDGFPAPTEAAMKASFDAFNAVPPDQVIIVDGLALGAMDSSRLAKVKAPIVAMVHHPLGLETGLDQNVAEIMIRNEASVLACVRHIIVPSGYIARILAARLDVPPQKITVARPGFDGSVNQRTPSSPPIILSVGLLTRRKGHDILLKALARLTHLDWQAVIIGKAHDPEVAAALRAQCTSDGLDDRVQFTGEVDADALEKAYQSASIFALATRYEGYGMVLNEAMQYGLPVVTCRVGAVPDTVGDAALLVEPDAPEQFAHALAALLKEPQTAQTYASLSLERLDTLADWHNTVHSFVQVIENAQK